MSTSREIILQQIAAQRNIIGDQYYQGVFGSAETMADILQQKGVNSLADLGQKDKYQTTAVEAQYSSPDGKILRDLGDMGFGYAGFEEWVIIPKDQIKTTYGTYTYTSDGENNYADFKPLTATELATIKDGQFQKNIGTVIINKTTGEELTDTTQELAYQSSSGGANKKKNWLNVNFTKEGVPVLTASNQKSGLGAVIRDVIPMAALFLPLVLPGLGAAISGALPGAAVAATGVAAAVPATLLNTVITQGLIGGGIATIGGGDFEKAFLRGAVSSAIGAGIGGDTLGNVGAGAVTGGVLAKLTGGDFIDGAVAGALSSGGGQVVGESIGLDGRVASSVGASLVKGVVAELQGKDVTDAMIAGAISGALSYKDSNTNFDATAREGSLAKETPDENGETKSNYTLFEGANFPKLEGIKTQPIMDAGANVGESPVDYSLFDINRADMPDGFGLNEPTSSNLDYMGGGQGLSSGAADNDDAFDATAREGSLAKETPESEKSSLDVEKLIKAGIKSLSGVAAGSAVNYALNSSSIRSSAPLSPVNLEYGDIYKDAPIKGFAMRKGEDGKYTPFIGEKALLAKGGLASRRK